jgi:hypothetical protein
MSNATSRVPTCITPIVQRWLRTAVTVYQLEDGRWVLAINKMFATHAEAWRWFDRLTGERS